MTLENDGKEFEPTFLTIQNHWNNYRIWTAKNRMWFHLVVFWNLHRAKAIGKLRVVRIYNIAEDKKKGGRTQMSRLEQNLFFQPNPLIYFISRSQEPVTAEISI